MKWQEKYKNKLISVDQAAGLVKSGDVVSLPLWDAPRDICFALARRKDELRNVTLQGMWNQYYPWLDPGMEESFTLLDYFALRNYARQGVWERRIDWVPWLAGLNSNPARFESAPARGRNFTHADVFMLKVTPPNKHGYCSFGRAVWWNHDAVRTSRISIAEVDPEVIWTYGEYLHVSEVTHLVEATAEEYRPQAKPALPFPPEDEAAIAPVIGANIAGLVKDGDTIEVGSGTASEAVLEFLGGRNDLGIDAELIMPQQIDLIKAGVVTGRRKNIDRAKHTATAIVAYPEDPRTPTVLDYVDRNAAFELRGGAKQIDVARIAGVDNMVAINNALAVDLTGQVVIDHLGTLPVSGTGGQLEYNIGSHYSKGGRSITALMSTAKGGTVSRIVPRHEAGAMIQIPCVYLDYLVTEHGVVNLEGKSRRQRAEAIISVAHPDFKPELTRAARKLFYP